MSNIEHRRISFTGGVIDTPDPDWAGTHTRWTAGEDLASGEIVEVNPSRGALSFYWELYDGVGDGASPVDPVGVTVAMQVVTRHRVRDKDSFELGSVQSGASGQRRQTELEVPDQGQSVARVTATAGLAGDGAIWIFASEEIKP